MSGTIPAARQHLIDAIARQSRTARTARDTPLPLGPFVQAYYRGVDEADLRAGDPGALAAAAAPPLRVGAARKPPRFLRHGDVCTVEIEGIGPLTNPCIAEASLD